MQSITVGFSKPKTWKPFAWLIMTGYDIPYDHVYIKFHSDSYDRDLIYQASGLAVNFTSPTIFDSINTTVKEFQVNITDENKKLMVQFAIDNAGKPYGMLDVLGLAWVRLCQLFGKNVKNPVNADQTTWVCCELVAYILEQYADESITETLSSITPKDLYNFMNSKLNG